MGEIITKKPTEEKPEEKPIFDMTKQEHARKIARENPHEPYHKLKKKIMEEVKCGKTTAHKAIRYTREKKPKTTEKQRPSLIIKPEPEKKAEFLEKEPIEIIPIQETQKPDLTQEEALEQLELFQDMLRGLHVLIFAKDGVIDLLSKAGRPEKQCREVSDQLYRWLKRRYTVEELERFDTILLIGSYGILIGAIVKDILSQRKKEEEKKK